MTTINAIGSNKPIQETFGGTAQSSYTTGDILYASGSNTLSKLAIGSSTNVLTVTGGVPAWGAAPAGNGLVKLTTASVSGGSLIFNSTFITTTYAHYFISWHDFANTNATCLVVLNLSTNNGSTYVTGTFQNASSYVLNTTTTNSGDVADQFSLMQKSTSSTGVCAGQTWLYNLTTNLFAQYECITTQTVTNNGATSSWGWRNTAAIYNCIKFNNNGADTLTGGSATLYGVAQP